MRILITGGAGFIGSHLSDRLLRAGHHVRVLDALLPQVHGPGQARPEYLAPEVELIRGDVRDRETVLEALDACEAVYHLAARVGVGQSMYQIADYTAVNSCGTAVLLEALIDRPVRRLVVASSMSIYGEGRCRTEDGTVVDPPLRDRADMARGEWEHVRTGARLEPVPTSEDKPPSLASVYALNKYDQERLCLMFGEAYSIPTVALRFFNVYGPRQALSNPYTGVLAIFASRLLNNQAPLIFEDGGQRRDFVSVHDVARACVLALDSEEAAGRALNIASGRSCTVLEVAAALTETLAMGSIGPEVTGRYRVGDIRHCFADITRARELLGYEPRVTFPEGLRELAAWLRGRPAVDRFTAAAGELEQRGLTL